jgi:hypothetical protein
MIEFIDGPLWYLALTVFILGVAWRLIGLIAMKRPTDLSQARTNNGGIGGAIKALLLHSVPHGGNLGRTLYHFCLLYTSDAADDSLRVDLGGRGII